MNRNSIQLITSFLLLAFMVLLVASCQTVLEELESSVLDCSLPYSSDDSQVSQQSDDTHEETLQQWVETQTIGKTHITREYLDGENDYIVTELESSDEGLSRKRVRHYLNGEVVFDEVSRFNVKGVLELKETTTTEDGKLYFESFQRLSALYKTVKGQIVNQALQGTICYFDFEDKIVAEGTQDFEIMNDDLCTVEKLTVFDSTGEVNHYEERILGSNIRYTYREYKDTDNKVLWSRETADGLEVIFLGGEKGGICNSTNDEVTFYDNKEQMIGRCIINGNQLELVELGAEYNTVSAVNRIQEWQYLKAERDWLNEMVLQSR